MHYPPAPQEGEGWARQSRKKYLATVGAVLMFAIFGFMAVDRGEIMTYKGFYLSPQKISPGGTMTAALSVVRYKECPGTVKRVLIFNGGLIYHYDAVPAALQGSIEFPAAQRKMTEFPIEGTINRVFTIPLDSDMFRIPRGPAIYKAEISYYCNILQKVLNWPILLRTPEMPFELVD